MLYLYCPKEANNDRCIIVIVIIIIIFIVIISIFFFFAFLREGRYLRMLVVSRQTAEGNWL